MKQAKRLPVGTLAIFAVALLSLTVSLRHFRQTNEEVILETSAEFLQENTVYYAGLASGILESRLRFVNNLATILKQHTGEHDSEELTEMLHTMAEDSELDVLVLVPVEEQDRNQSLQDADFFKRGLQGESGIAAIDGSALQLERQYIAYYAPVLLEGEVTALVVGGNFYQSLEELCERNLEKEYTHNYLVDARGQVILADSGAGDNNPFETLSERMEQDAYDELVASMENNNSIGYGNYRGDYDEGLVCFSALGVNDWYVLRLFSSEKTAEIVAPLNRSATLLEITLTLSLILAVVHTVYRVYVKYNQKNRMMEAALEAMAESIPRLIKVDFRSGKAIFIRDQDARDREPFQPFEWEKFREEFLETVLGEDREKCKSFLSRENMRRVSEQNIAGDTCIYRRQCKDEYQWMQTAIIPMKSEEDCILLYVKRVDESVRAEELYKEQLWRAMQKAKAADVEKTAFLEFMSRHLNYPTRIIRELSHSARRFSEEGKPVETQRLLGCIDELGNYIQTLLSDILEIGIRRERSLKCVKQSFSLQELLNNFKDCYNITVGADKQIFLEVSCEGELQSRYWGDETRIIQILGEMQRVALAAVTQKNYTLCLHARLEEAGEKSDKIAILLRGRKGQEEVNLASEARAALEELPGGGEELPGMTLSELALETMEGTTDEDSYQEAVKNFGVFIRLEHVSPEKDKQPVRVLVVDDNSLNLEVAVEILQAEGYETESFDGGEQALRCFLESEPGHFQVLLTDIKMPGMDGHELAAAVRKSGRVDSESIRIIALTAYADAQERKAAEESGIETLLEKPFHVEQFKKLLQEREEV